MLATFILALRDAGIPASVTEHLALLRAMKAGVADYSVDDFYHLSRAALVKDERHLDRFDRVFGEVFKGLEKPEGDPAQEIPEEWLRKLAEKLLERPDRLIGVILLMFGVGLQFHIEELLAVRRIAVPGAVAQSGVATALGALFVFMQAEEYGHAYHELGLTLNSGIYGATFFLLTGFHGFHVSMGTLMLFVILLRSMKGHFKPDHHFAFEGVAWYWHFVDVVWIGLFIFVYWL